MPDATIERKTLRIPCVLEVPGTVPLYGQTRDLSTREASLQSPALAVPDRRKPRTGDTGVLTLAPRGRESARDMLKIPCRVAHVMGNMVSVQLNSVGLNSKQQERLAALLRAESPGDSRSR